jgi:hypothetical protein
MDGITCPDAESAKLASGSYDLLGLCLPSEVPTEIEDKLLMIKEQILGSVAGPYISDLYRSSRSIFVSLAMSVVFSIIFIYFLSAFGVNILETIAWICVVIIQLAFIALAGLGFMKLSLVLASIFFCAVYCGK